MEGLAFPLHPMGLCIKSNCYVTLILPQKEKGLGVVVVYTCYTRPHPEILRRPSACTEGLLRMTFDTSHTAGTGILIMNTQHCFLEILLRVFFFP
jgi:hypothetical protein